MAFLKITSPHAHGPMSTGRVMRLVIISTLPGLVALTWFFGFGTLSNILWASAGALAFEALALKLRKRPIGFYLSDCSALVTAILLGIIIMVCLIASVFGVRSALKIDPASALGG